MATRLYSVPNPRHRGSLRFNGTTQGIKYSGGKVGDDYPIVLSCWVRTPDAPGNTNFFFGFGEAGLSPTNWCGVSFNTGGYARALHQTYGGSNLNATTGNAWSADTWHHLAAEFHKRGGTYDVKVVLDGDWANRGTTSSVGPNPLTGINDSIWVGSMRDSTDAYANGNIVHAAMWQEGPTLDADFVERLAFGDGDAATRLYRDDLIFYAPLTKDLGDTINTSRTVEIIGSEPAREALHPYIHAGYDDPLLLPFGDASASTISASGAFVAPMATMAAGVEVAVEAQVAAVAPMATMSATVAVEVQAQGAAIAPMPTFAAQAQIVVAAQVAAVAPIATFAAGVGVITEAQVAAVAPMAAFSAAINLGSDRQVSAAFQAPMPAFAAQAQIVVVAQMAAVAPMATFAAVVGDPLQGPVLIKTRVFDFFATQFPAQYPDISIAWQGLPFAPPSGAPWVRVSVLPGQRKTITLGPGAIRRRTGFVYVDVFAPFEDSPNAALDSVAIAANVEQMFDGGTIAGLRLRAASTREIGPDPQLPFYHSQVTVEFSRDDTPM